jgi:hypothetical protein
MKRQATRGETIEILDKRRTELRKLPHYLSSGIGEFGITIYVSKITDELPSTLEEGDVSAPVTIVKSERKYHTMEGIVDK